MRARNMQALTDDTKRRHPGVVIYGVGDDAHKLRYSDHNEDDTEGSKAPQSDADNVPEHRAIDVMLGAAFSKAQALAYIADLLADPAALKRLYYIIFDGHIWSRSNNWVRRDFDGDPHTDHIHVSGWAADDENAAPWPAVYGGDMSLTKEERAALLGGALVKDNILHWRLRSIQDSEDPLLAEKFPNLVVPAPGLKQLDARVAKIEQAPGGVDMAAMAELVRRVVREELDKTKLAGG